MPSGTVADRSGMGYIVMRSSWDLVKAGRFDEAVGELTDELSATPAPWRYSNRGIAYINLGALDRARDDFNAAEHASTTRGDSYRLKLATVQWLQGLEADAVKTWIDVVRDLDGNRITYTDAAGGVESPCMLWFAGVRLAKTELCEIATKSLRKMLGRKQAKCWPGVLGRLVLGQAAPAEAREAVSTVPILRERQLCQAEFYIAWTSLMEENKSACLEALDQSARLGDALLEMELYLARYELCRMSTEK